MNSFSLATETAGAGDPRVAADPQVNRGSGRFHLAQTSGGGSQEFKLAPARVLPDPAICRARPAGFADYADCLVEGAFQCPHALSFGYGFLCRHPQRHEIVGRTSLGNGLGFDARPIGEALCPGM